MLASCSTQEELSYLNNLDAAGGEDHFTMEIPDYEVQARDILYISAKTQTPDGRLEELLADKTASGRQLIFRANPHSISWVTALTLQAM